MEIKIDLVPALHFPSFCLPYSIVSSNCDFNVLFKQNLFRDKDGDFHPVAVNKAEAELLQQLPPSAIQGFKFAQAIRVGHLYPSHFTTMLKFDATHLEDYMTTFMLKTSLFFLFLCLNSELYAVHVWEWTFLILKHLEMRLVKGILLNFSGRLELLLAFHTNMMKSCFATTHWANRMRKSVINVTKGRNFLKSRDISSK